MNNKNILVLTPTPSYPQDAGNRKRIYALTKYLQELGATIYFVYCPREWDREIPQDAFNGMHQCWDYFFMAYPVQRSVHQTENEYFELDAWWDVGIEFTVNWIKLAVDFDMVLCNYIFYSKVLELFDEKVTKVIDTHDIMSNRNYLLDKKLGYRDFFYVSPESEKKALERAHLVLSIKEDESNWFECLSSTPVLTIGHLEPKPTVTIDRQIEYENLKLGFIGSANPINVKNLESFLDKYLALYSSYSDRLTFVVGGKVCQALDPRFSDRVEIIGMVDDVAEFYEQIDIAILPFEFSTGLKIKTVEALSWQKPCMGTVNAFEGLGSSSKHHSFASIEELALGIKDLIDNPQMVHQLQQGSEVVFTNYCDRVKEAIAKLYQADWKSIKENQLAPAIASDVVAAKTQTYNFNLITNVDFWNVDTNKAQWINFWVDNARKLGNVHIYRTQDFNNLSSDKLALYKLGLVDNVHQRELYQIVDLFKISPDANVAFVDLIDFGSIACDPPRLQELEQIKLAKNHFLWYFCDRTTIDADEVVAENAREYFNRSDRPLAVEFWDLNSNLSKNYEGVSLSSNPIDSNSTEYQPADLQQITIATTCLAADSITELDKLVRCCQDFLPQHFELIIFSNLNIVKQKYHGVVSLNQAKNTFHQIDIFTCLEEPTAVSFFIYLAVCQGIPLYFKDATFSKSLTNIKNAEHIANLTSIPKAYKSFLKSVFSQHDANLFRHQSWQQFIEHWVQTQQIAAIDRQYSTIEPHKSGAK